jgi:hypothetical protein
MVPDDRCRLLATSDRKATGPFKNFRIFFLPNTLDPFDRFLDNLVPLVSFNKSPDVNQIIFTHICLVRAHVRRDIIIFS